MIMPHAKRKKPGVRNVKGEEITEMNKNDLTVITNRSKEAADMGAKEKEIEVIVVMLTQLLKPPVQP